MNRESTHAERLPPDPSTPTSLFARLVRQGLGFTVVGGAQLLLDWGVMVGLSALGVNLSVANVAGRAAGACLGFWGNGRLTFAGGSDTWTRQGVRFVVLWLVLTVLSTLAVNGVAHFGSPTEAWLLKPLIEASLSLISFFSCRHWVFR